MFKHARSAEEAFVNEQLFKRHCKRPDLVPMRRRVLTLLSAEEKMNLITNNALYHMTREELIGYGFEYNLQVPTIYLADPATYITLMISAYSIFADKINSKVQFKPNLSSWSGDLTAEERIEIITAYNKNSVTIPTGLAVTGNGAGVGAVTGNGAGAASSPSKNMTTSPSKNLTTPPPKNLTTPPQTTPSPTTGKSKPPSGPEPPKLTQVQVAEKIAENRRQINKNNLELVQIKEDMKALKGSADPDENIAYENLRQLKKMINKQTVDLHAEISWFGTREGRASVTPFKADRSTGGSARKNLLGSA